MLVRRFGKLRFYHLKLFVFAFAITLIGIRAVLVANAHAATLPPPEKGIHAELIVNGKVIPLTPVTLATKHTSFAPYASQNCVFVNPSVDNVRQDGEAAYFDYTLQILNGCTGAAVESGKWNSRGSIVCNGIPYANPPNGSGNLPIIRAQGSAFVQDGVPYVAVCVADNGSLYPPSEVDIASLINGTLSNGNTFADSTETSFFP